MPTDMGEQGSNGQGADTSAATGSDRPTPRRIEGIPLSTSDNALLSPLMHKAMGSTVLAGDNFEEFLAVVVKDPKLETEEGRDAYRLLNTMVCFYNFRKDLLGGDWDKSATGEITPDQNQRYSKFYTANLSTFIFGINAFKLSRVNLTIIAWLPRIIDEQTGEVEPVINMQLARTLPGRPTDEVYEVDMSELNDNQRQLVESLELDPKRRNIFSLDIDNSHTKFILRFDPKPPGEASPTV